MRCAVCGTENTPDSRFCGGCGARQSPPEVRVAPTTKMPNDAPFPPSVPPGVYVAPTPPPSMAPIQQRHQSAPPAAVGSTPPADRPHSAPPISAPPRPASIPPATPRIASPSVSMPAAAQQQRWGLIVVVLLIDLGLAAAGAVMLAKGLAKTKAEPAPTSGSAAVAPTAVAPAAPAAPPSMAPGSASAGSATPAGSGSNASIEPAPEPAIAPSKPVTSVAGRSPPAAAHAVAAVPAQRVPAAAAVLPADPYTGATDLDAEVDRRVSGRDPQLAKCSADQLGPVHGEIKVAFQVLGNGAVAHAAAVENTTGSQALGACLAGVLGTWTFASHPGEPANFVRPFAYP